MKIYNQLLNIQAELKAPKSQKNTFGKYNYRSAEDILEALKPLLKKEKLTQIISDEIVQIGDRYYVKATVTLFNEENETINTVAYARESEEKKGMDSSQVTGATSSYARKYALNGMYAIDDNKDPDTDEYYAKTMKKANLYNEGKAIQEILNLSKKYNFRDEELKAILENVGIKTLKGLKEADYKKAIEALNDVGNLGKGD